MQLLKNKNGLLSGKRISGFGVLFVCIVMAVVDQITAYKMNEIAFTALLAYSGTMSGLTLKDKKDINIEE